MVQAALNPPESSRTDGRRRTCRGPGCSAGPNSCTSTFGTEALTSPVPVRVKAHSHSSAALLPPVGWFDWSGPGRSRLFLLPDRSEPEPRVIHEARGRSQDGSVQEAVEGEETDPGGADPAVPASSAAHPPHQREYSDAPVDPRHRTQRLSGSW